MQSVFYSWQSDLPNSTNRGFIQDCLERAIKDLRAEGAVHIDPSPDRDTQGVPGSPDISDTIFDKIDSCAAFVGDMSLINGCRNSEKAGCDCTRLTPNPNVLCEWGRATKSVGFQRVISIFNEVTGTVEELPFDLRKRTVVTYRLQAGDDKSEQRRVLVGKLKQALKDILELPRTELNLEFADRIHHRPIGTSVVVRGKFLQSPPTEEIPDYGSRKGSGRFGDLASLVDNQPNKEYYREASLYLLASNLIQPVSLVVANLGDRLLRNVRVEATVSRVDDNGLVFFEKEKMLALPQRHIDRFANISNLVGKIGPTRTGDAEITILPDRYKIGINFGNVQAKALVFSEVFLAGSRDSQQINVQCLLFADELSRPEEITLAIDFQTEQDKLTLDDLKMHLPGQKISMNVDSGEIIEDE